MEGASPGDEDRVERVNRTFNDMVPHNRALGIRVVAAGPRDAVCRLPYDPRLVGDPDRGILHGGAITSLMDATCGVAVFLALDEPRPCATLDLRIDYMRPAEPGRDVLTRAECVRATTHVAFTRALAYHDGAEDAPIAAAAGTFMIGAARTGPGRWPRQG